MTNEHFMLLAVGQAEQARLIAPPNPWVGACIVQKGQVVGLGHTQEVGGHHAEVMAIQNAGSRTQGATLYCTLEPCCHTGRTPPCTAAIIKAGIKKCVVALEDPDPHMQGRGFEALKQAGIEVILGVGKAEAESSLRPYLHHRGTGRPYCVAKAAISIDGRLAAADGSSKWISSKEARCDAHALRARSGAILIGAETALSDRPTLTVRDAPFHSQPVRVILDRSSRVPHEGPLFDETLAKTLVFSDDIPSVLDQLGKLGIIQLLIEGGGQVLGAFLESGFVNELITYIGPKIIGSSGTPLFGGFTRTSMHEAIALGLQDSCKLGDTIKIRYRLT